MNRDWRQWGLDVISGKARGIGPLCARCAATAIEPLYSLAMIVRNEMYERGALAAADLGRPTISVGNITTGGTGKTPMIHWLARQLAGRDLHPAILMRGYRSSCSRALPSPDRGQETAATGGDEQRMLESLLADIDVKVYANPDRIAAARKALADRPETGVFLLDDGFQHRRAARDLDIVLISATQPWGFGHVIPRGLLREPRAGLARADVIIITRSDLAPAGQIEALKSEIRGYNSEAPIFLARHVLTGLKDGDTIRPLSDLNGRRYFAFAGIGEPAALEQQIKSLPGTLAASHWLGDHHDYAAGLDSIVAAARAAEADLLMTTEKDWAKIAGLPAALPIWRLGVEMQIDQDQQLLDHIEQAVAAAALG